MKVLKIPLKAHKERNVNDFNWKHSELDSSIFTENETIPIHLDFDMMELEEPNYKHIQVWKIVPLSDAFYIHDNLLLKQDWETHFWKGNLLTVTMTFLRTNVSYNWISTKDPIMKLVQVI